MESIKFWYVFEDEDGNIPQEDVDITISSESGINLQDMCEAFVRFAEAAGFSSENLSHYFSD